MCYVTATELKKNLSHYLKLSLKEDVYVTKNNIVICMLINPQQRALFDAIKLSDEIEAKATNIEINDDDALYEEIKKHVHLG